VRRHAKASSTEPQTTGFGRIGLACLATIAVAFLGIGASPAGAVDTCPNAIFRTGPSAKLPDCRAYELVSPTYTGSIPPTFQGFLGDLPSMFATDTVTPAGDSVVYNTVGGALSGFPGTGYVDRYRARRTGQGWVTESTSPDGSESEQSGPGGISSDHEYSFGQATHPPLSMTFLRTPNGYEPLARGSLGDARFDARGDWITAGATHVIFTSQTKLEPNAQESGLNTVYDRTPGGPTHVVSLLPGNVTPSNGASWFLGTTKDGEEVAFTTGILGSEGSGGPIYVRRHNAVTKEVFRLGGVAIGKKLECTGGPGSATLSYQWLHNGSAIGGATSATYTTTAADEGEVVQCQVTASNAEGTTVTTGNGFTNQFRLVEPYQEKEYPSGFAGITPSGSSATVGTLLSCEAGGSFTTSSYQWLKDGAAIGGATSSTYAPVEADVDHSLQCRRALSNANGTLVAYSQSVSIYSAVPKASANPAISNVTNPGDSTPAVGDELSCSQGTWSGSPTFAYQWLRNGEEIGGATSSIYVVVAEDEGKALQCRLSATNAAGATQAVSAPVVPDPQPGTAPPQLTTPESVSGTPQIGSSLSCSQGTWSGGPTFAYQWLRNGEEIGSATSFSYTLTAADLGKVVQCRVKAANAGAAAVAIDANEGAKVVTRAVPKASASLPQPGFTFDGIFNARVFYADTYTDFHNVTSNLGNLYMYDLDSEKTTTIANSGDAAIINVSEDGSHVYFVSQSLIDGEGQAGQPNLGVWSAETESATYIATLAEEDVTTRGFNQTASLTTWYKAISADTFLDRGKAMDHSRSTPDGSVFAFESTAQLTSFDNSEATPAACGSPQVKEEGGVIVPDRCDEVYRYDTVSEDLTCVSCGPGAGPATGNARLQSLAKNFGTGAIAPATYNSPVESLTTDGDTVFFESTEGLVPSDGNATNDVYRWSKGNGVALISTGQSSGESALYGVTPDGSNVIFATREKLLPEDENGSTARLYDARVDGGFPPPEETVTEPCAGDACQGQAASAPESPNVASSSLNGGGNVASKLKCGRHSRRVVRKGSERCVQQKRHKHRRHRSPSHGKRRAAR
jgi:hypothetical protein